MLVQASQWLQQEMHPTVIISAYREALEDLITILKDKVSESNVIMLQKYYYGKFLHFGNFKCVCHSFGIIDYYLPILWPICIIRILNLIFIGLMRTYY